MDNQPDINTPESQSPKRRPLLRFTVALLITAIVATGLALVINYVFFESFTVEGYSMQPTINDGERNDGDYDVILLNTVVTPERGDIIVFFCDWFNQFIEPKNLVKRVIGVAGDTVEVLVWQRTDLGFKVIVENRFGGLLYANEVFRPLEVGDRLEAYVKQVRPDGKIDLSLQRPGGRPEHDFAAVLLEHLRRHGGHIDQHDGSPAEEIYRVFGVSKKVFKRAVGELYRKRLVTLAPDGIDLVARK